MIPGQFEDPPRPAVAAAIPPTLTPAVVTNSRAGETPLLTRLELPGWAKASIFAALLLAASWLVMWLDATTR